MKTKLGAVPAAKVGAEVDEDVQLFSKYLGNVVQGLLSGNNYECEGFTYQVLKPEEVLEWSAWYASEMVKIVQDREE